MKDIETLKAPKLNVDAIVQIINDLEQDKEISTRSFLMSDYLIRGIPIDQPIYLYHVWISNHYLQLKNRSIPSLLWKVNLFCYH